MSSERDRGTAVTSLLMDTSSSVTSSPAVTRSIRHVSSQRETGGATDGSRTDRQTDGETKEHMERWRDVSPSHCLHPVPDTESVPAESDPPDRSTTTH